MMKNCSIPALPQTNLFIVRSFTVQTKRTSLQVASERNYSNVDPAGVLQRLLQRLLRD